MFLLQVYPYVITNHQIGMGLCGDDAKPYECTKQLIVLLDALNTPK